MAVAFVLLNTELGAETEVIGSLRKLEGVEEVHMVYGAYDILAKIKAKDMSELAEIVTRHLRSLDKLRSTLTLMTIEGI